MKALSIRQPWAFSILHGGKDVENRTWPTKVRGRVLIHAGATKPTRLERRGWLDFLDDAGLAGDWGRGLTELDFDLDLGGVVGSVEIVDCVREMNSPWFFGPWGFVLRDPRVLPFRPCHGALGFFDVEAGS